MPQNNGLSRRSLLQWGGAAAGVMVAGAILPNFGISAALAADLGEGDIGVLNYAYALEQLEAAFYTMVTDKMYADARDGEADLLGQIRDHEIAHRDFLKKALGHNAIPDLEVNFSKVHFGSRKSVLGTADTFENLGVAAYNGAGHLIQKVDYLAAAGTIVSVEARHASVIAQMLHGDDTHAVDGGHVNSMGLDEALSPAKVLPKAKPFIKTPVTAMSLT